MDGPSCLAFGTSGRREPAAVTLTDLLVVVFGCAMAFSVPDFSLWDVPFLLCGYGRPPLPAWAPSLWRATEWSLQADLVLSFAVLARCRRYRRAPRPAEWLAVLGAAFLAVRIIRYQIVHDYYILPDDAGPAAWSRFANWLVNGSGDATLATAGALGCLAGLVVAALIRRRVPAWAWTLLIAGAALSFLLGPGAVLPELATDALRNLGRPDRSLVLRVQAGLALGRLPSGLLIGSLAIAAVRSQLKRCKCRRGNWVEWMALVSALPLTLYRLSDWFYDWPYRFLDFERFVIRGAALAVWAIVVAGGGLLVVRYLGPAWNRWIGPGYDEDRAAPSSAGVNPTAIVSTSD